VTSDLGLLRRNRRIVAERVGGWPDGTVKNCELIETAYPDWNPWWRAASTIRGRLQPAGYYATRRRARHGEPSAYGATSEELIQAIRTWPVWKWDWSVEPPPGERAGR
jgi:hypothetical protein